MKIITRIIQKEDEMKRKNDCKTELENANEEIRLLQSSMGSMVQRINQKEREIADLKLRLQTKEAEQQLAYSLTLENLRYIMADHHCDLSSGAIALVDRIKRLLDETEVRNERYK